MAAFWVIFAVFLFWVIPVFPWGMSPEDYSPEVLLGLFLLGCCPGVTAIALIAKSIATQRREALLAWSSIYDRTTGLRNRDFFLDRLQLQCDFARDLEEYRLGLILLSIDETLQEGVKPQPVNNELFRRIGRHLTRQLRPNDLLAAISSTEMAILITDGSEAALSAIAARVAHSLEVRIRGLAGDASGRLSIEMGFASLEGDGSAPQTLLEAARSRLRPIYSTQDSRVA